jgi:Cu+-exporting ATPase
MSKPHGPHGNHAHGGSAHDASSGGKAIDPVCGMAVDPATAEHRAKHDGHDYVFCSAGCRTKCAAHPDTPLGEKPVAMVAPS